MTPSGRQEKAERALSWRVLIPLPTKSLAPENGGDRCDEYLWIQKTDAESCENFGSIRAMTNVLELVGRIASRNILQNFFAAPEYQSQ
jgi:hypothetical protein